MLPLIIGGAMVAGGIIGSLSNKPPKYDTSGVGKAMDLLNSQEQAVNAYFDEANSLFETQYSDTYGEDMTTAINSLASNGIYDSPVSEYQLNKQRKALSTQYATGKSQLAGQKMQALSSIESQKAGYYAKLTDIQYANNMAKYNKKQELWGALSGVGGAVMGAGGK